MGCAVQVIMVLVLVGAAAHVYAAPVGVQQQQQQRVSSLRPTAFRSSQRTEDYNPYDQYESCQEKDEMEDEIDEISSAIAGVMSNYDTVATYWDIAAPLSSTSAYNKWYQELSTGYKYPLECTEETITGAVSDSDENPITGVVRSFSTVVCAKATDITSNDTHVWKHYFGKATSYSDTYYTNALQSLYSQQKYYNETLAHYSDDVTTLEQEVEGSDCSEVSELIYDLVTDNGDSSDAIKAWFGAVGCEATNGGLVLAAMAANKLVDTVIIATVPVLGEWIAAMQAEPECESVFSTTTWSVTLGNNAYTYDKIVEVVTNLFCYFEDDISLLEDISFISQVCNDVKQAEEIVEAMIDIACGNPISAVMDILKPIILCNINVDGTNCGESLGYTWYC